MKPKKLLSVLVMALALCVTTISFVSCWEEPTRPGGGSSGGGSSGGSSSWSCSPGWCTGSSAGWRNRCCPSSHPVKCATSNSCFRTRSDANASGCGSVIHCSRFF